MCSENYSLSWPLLVFFKREACWRERAEKILEQDRASQTSFAAHDWIHSGSHNLFSSAARFFSLQKDRSPEDFRQNRERQPRSSKSQSIVQWLGKAMMLRYHLLDFFAPYIFSKKFHNKKKPLNSTVQFMILMHSEFHKLFQSFELSCCVLSSSLVSCPPVPSCRLRNHLFLPTFTTAVNVSVTIGCLCLRLAFLS
jgi:hypothetical protein